MTSSVEVTRGTLVESRHIVHVAVAHADRGLVMSTGDAGLTTFVRSAIKMFQALPLVEDGVVDRYGLTSEEIALCTASHNAEPFHVDAARRILAKAGVTEDALACGPHPPMLGAAADALRASGIVPGRIHNNCSGKHAGMLALAKAHGWRIDGYHLPAHPVQRRVAQTLSHWTGVRGDRMTTAVDGCGLPTFAVPLDAVALACARFAAAAAEGAPASRVVAAMTGHPEYVAGTSRMCTALMTTARGRIFAKTGAEGYYCAGAPEARLGLALKIEDGAKRASEPALLAALAACELLSPAEMEALHEYARPSLLNTRGEVVGELRARLTLQPASP
jgi:L-asparaginase II